MSCSQHADAASGKTNATFPLALECRKQHSCWEIAISNKRETCSCYPLDITLISSTAVCPRTPRSVRNITGNALTTIKHIYKDCCLKEAASIIKKPHHPEALFSLLPLGRRYRSLNPTPPGSGTVKYAPLNHPDPEPAWMTSLTSTELIPQPMDSLSMTLQLIFSVENVSRTHCWSTLNSCRSSSLLLELQQRFSKWIISSL
ncbi:uncharacterized protein LOC132404917 [Hypanus sabinus]|uniref:uncharacterized protein LOC132404917 n=1 Tax=Hypanus sabinus TaxID=79690 RepID=UPI0028C40684|nr:uncharacterized protein LOC132404917 [Hypanus sabinus]